MIELSSQVCSELSLEPTKAAHGETLPPTVLPIILLPCLKGPVGLMISYRLVNILTQEEDEWQGTAPTPDTRTQCVAG